MAQEIYFKVIDRATRKSAMIGHIPKEFVVTYHANKWVKAPVGGLFVFDNQYLADMFAIDGTSIWPSKPYLTTVRCHVKDIYQSKLVLNIHYLSAESIKEFWEGKPCAFNHETNSSLYGAWIAKEVKCLE